MSKTAIQQAIEFCEQNVVIQSEQMGLEYKTLDYKKVIAKLTELKEVEKQNIDELLQMTKTLFENLQEVYSYCSDRLNDFESNEFVSEYKEIITKFDKL